MSRSDYEVPPPVGSGEVPQLHRLPGLKFQALCRDLLDSQVGQCAEFGVNGQLQHGVDLLATRRDGKCDVGQCKCERDFPPAKIKAATQDFLDHWEYWKDKNVARFVLFVGSEINQRQRQEEILKQGAIFQGLGIEYGVWPASKITNALRPHPGIVATHLGQGWAKYICGSVEEPSARLQLAGMSALNERLSLALSDATDTRVSDARELWLSGKREAATQGLAKIRTDSAAWQALTPGSQSSVLRLQASILLDSGGDTALAEELLVQAVALKAEAHDCLLRASILWRRGNMEEALAELSASDTERATVQKAVFLTALGRAAEAEAVLSGVTSDTAERFRAEALVHLARHRIAEARSASLKALDLAPTYSIIRLTAAIVDYYSALSQDALPTQIPAWPDPVSWKFVRRDDGSQQRLGVAGERFRQLLSEAEHPTADRRCLEVWRLACSANDAERQEQATLELERLLTNDPGNHRSLVWATARFPQVDCAQAFDALRSAVIDKRANSEEIIALAQYYVARSQFAKALKLLEAQHNVFAREHVISVWIAWKAQVVALLNGREAALEVLRSGALTRTDALSLEAHIIGLTGGDGSLPLSLMALYRETGNSKHLLEAVEAYAQRKEWETASDHCEETLKSIGTAEVAWLTIVIAHRARRPDLCLRLLNESQQLFPQSRLPLELRRLQVHSQQLLGFVPPAIQEASRIADEEPSAQNLLEFAELLFSIGDQRQLCSVAERVLRLTQGATTEGLLRLAWQCQWEDAALSRRLWTRASTLGLLDDQVAQALLLGHNLGLDSRLTALTHRMMDLASRGEGNVQLATLDQLRRLSIDFYENAKHLLEQYGHAQVPIHLIALPLNQTLAHFFQEQRADAAKSPFAWPAPPLMARHGRKTIGETRKASEPWTIKADVSALLLAYHYEFLEKVERVFGPIRVPPQLVPSLLLMQDRLATAQLSRMTAYRELVTCYLDGKITGYEAAQPAHRDDVPAELQPDWLGAYQRAKEDSGFLVDFIPIPTEASMIAPDTLPRDLQQSLIGQRAILQSLWEFGPLTDEAFQAILEEVPSIRNEAFGMIPPPGSALFFRGTLIETFAAIGMLSQLIARFRIFVDVNQMERLKAELCLHDRHCETAKWVKALITRVSDGIQSGLYEVLPKKIERQEAAGDHSDTNPDAEGLENLLRPADLVNERFWVDDRWMNGYERAGTVEIVDSLDVLEQLVSNGVMSSGDYYALVGRMRADGVCFIPLRKEEILECMQSARTRNGEIVETTTTGNLRRGVAFSLLQCSLLKRDVPFTPQASRLNELGFLLQTMRAVEDALAALHTLYTDSLELRARRTWVVDSLYASPAALRRLAQLPGTDADGEYLEAIGLAGLIMKAVSMQESASSRRAAREYMEWIFSRLIKPRVQFQPQFLSRIALSMSHLLQGVVPESTDDLSSSVSAAILCRLFGDFPTGLRSELLKNTDLISRLGIKAISVVEFGGMRLDGEQFLTGAAKAMNGQMGVVHQIGGDEDVVFTPTDPAGLGFRFENLRTGQTGNVEDPIFRLLVASIEQRESFATSLLTEYDVPASERAGAVADLVVTEELSARIHKAESHREQDLAQFLAGLRSTIAARLPLQDADCLPKRVEAICRFLRASPHDSFDSDTAAHAYSKILADHPIEEALARLIQVPIELPDSLERELMLLPGDRKREVVKYILRNRSTPLAAVQLARLLVHCFGDQPSFRRLANVQMNHLVRDRGVEVKAYLTLARWATNRLRLWPETEVWPASLQLSAAWLLADCLLQTFISAGITPQWIVGRFTVTSVRAENIFENKSEGRGDVAHPSNVEPEVFVICGLAYAFADNPTALGSRLRQQVASTMLMNSEQHLFPVLPLLPNPGSASNRIGSFLGRDRITALYTSLEAEPESRLRTALEIPPLQQARAALETLGARGWLILAVVLGGFPPRDELLKPIADAMKTTDFAAGADEDLQLGALAISVASSLATVVTTDDMVPNRLKKQLFELVRKANRCSSSETEKVVAVVLECALNLARTKTTVKERVLEFSTLAVQLVLECPPLGEVIRSTIQRICEDLPMEQATELWRLNLRLRTAKIS